MKSSWIPCKIGSWLEQCFKFICILGMETNLRWGRVMIGCWGRVMIGCWGRVMIRRWGRVLIGCWGRAMIGCWGRIMIGCWGRVMIGCWGRVMIGCWGRVMIGCWGRVMIGCWVKVMIGRNYQPGICVDKHCLCWNRCKSMVIFSNVSNFQLLGGCIISKSDATLKCSVC